MTMPSVNTTDLAAATAIVVIAGRFAEDKKLDSKVVVGGIGLALGLALMGMANEKLAQQFAALVLIVALFMYVPTIAKKTGLIKSAPLAWGGGVRRAM